MTDKKEIIKLILCSSMMILLDQMLKLIIRANFLLYESKSIIDGIFSLTYIKNDGAAFGTFSGNSAVLYFIPLAIVSVTITYLIISFKELSAISKFSIVSIIAGGLSNLIDRIFVG